VEILWALASLIFVRLEDDMEIADLDEYSFNLDYADNNPGEKNPKVGFEDALDAAYEALEALVAAEAAQAEIESGKERAEGDEYFNPDDADDDPDEEAPQVGFEVDTDALGAP